MTPLQIHLGYVATGEAVEIPLFHLCATGQTQQSGKTTTLEALIQRSGLRALAFVTKRGEGSFSSGRRIGPYFVEKTDWRSVEAILESSMRQRLRFERAWLIRASKGARSLADVQKNVRRLMKDAKGLSADVYLLLNEYLEIVVPLIGRLPPVDAVRLEAGLNVMDLTAYPTELQMLVIRSALEWIYERERETITVLPEAWEFLPQGRGSPVKLAAAELARKGAGLKNYIWLDSQDIAGVEKEVLKQVSVWLLGVQRESNEIKRTLAHIPGGIRKPKPEDVATLARGQFWACWQDRTVKVYVQPAWMSEHDARAIARGEQAIEQVARPAPPPILPEEPVSKELEAKVDQLLEAKVDQLSSAVAMLIRHLTSEAPVGNDATRKDEPQRHREHREPAEPPAAAAPVPFNNSAEETLYQRFKTRLLEELPADPGLLRILTERPELEVSIKKEIVEVDGATPEGWVGRLIAEHFFDQPQVGYAAFTELKRRGAKLARPTIYDWCDKMVRKGFLVREGKSYQAVPGMKVNLVEK